MIRLARRKSIAVRLTGTIALLICLQSALWLSSLIAGGVLDTTRDNIYQAFHEKVENRRNYVQEELKKRWGNLQFFTGRSRNSFRFWERPASRVWRLFWLPSCVPACPPALS